MRPVRGVAQLRVGGEHSADVPGELELGHDGDAAVAAAGMWRVKYWAVIGFEVLLGVLLASACLSLMLASNLSGALLSVAVIAASGPLFWFLIRAMARIQMPDR